MIFRLRPNDRQAYSLKIATGNIQSTIDAVRNTWNKHFPADPFNYYFLDELFDSRIKQTNNSVRFSGCFPFWQS